MKRIIIILAALSIFVSACGPQAEATPEFTAEDIQATAVSIAWTMAAQTMEAMPTATLVPPTETPTTVPTATMTLIPTVAVLLPTNTPDKDPCDQILTSMEGKKSTLRIVNETKNIAIVSLYLTPYNVHNQCGYIPVSNLAKNMDTFVSVPYVGGYTYYVFVWLEGGNKSVEGGPYLIQNPDKHTLQIRDSGLKFVSP